MRGGQRLRCDSIIHEVLSFCIASLTLKRVASINQAPLGPTPQWDISSECPACGLEIGRDAASPKPDNYFCSLHDQIHQDTNDVPLRGLCFQTGFSSFLFCASHLNPTPEVFCLQRLLPFPPKNDDLACSSAVLAPFAPPLAILQWHASEQ